MEKYLVKNNLPKWKVIEHFFFCNKEQIRLARCFISKFLLKTDAIFNTNQLNLSLSTLVRVTNTMQIFTIAYCYITSKSAKFFFFLFRCLKDLIFHDKCPGPGVILGDFATRLAAIMLKKRFQMRDKDDVLNIA